MKYDAVTVCFKLYEMRILSNIKSNLNQDKAPDRGLNVEPSEYEARVLIT
jgi:hypothetical protein